MSHSCFHTHSIKVLLFTPGLGIPDAQAGVQLAGQAFRPQGYLFSKVHLCFLPGL